jgi:hypothetical protein
MQYFNIPIAAYIYSYNKQDKNMYDMTGLFILSICSFMYHNNIYTRFIGNGEPGDANTLITEYIIPDNVNYVYFLNDCVAIHVRSFLSVLTNYYGSTYFYEIITSCGIFHLTCVYNSCINVIVAIQELVPTSGIGSFSGEHLEEREQEFRRMKELLGNKNIKSEFLTTHYIYTFIPVGMDIFFIYLNMESDIAIPYACINIIILLLFVLDPFYKLTHIVFHLMLIAQNYYLCLSNSSISRA